MADQLNIGFAPTGDGQSLSPGMPGGPGINLTEPIVWSFPGSPAPSPRPNNAAPPATPPATPVPPPMTPPAPPPSNPPAPNLYGAILQEPDPPEEDLGAAYPAPGQTGMYVQQPAPPPGFEMPETLESPIWVPGFLRTQVGKLMRVEFLSGNQLTDRVGRLLSVGASYILLQAIDNSNIIMCDLFSIKFVSIVNSDLTPILVM